MAENSPVAGKILIEEEKYKKLKKFHQIYSQSRVSCKVLIDIASYKKLLDALKFKEDFERIVPQKNNPEEFTKSEETSTISEDFKKLEESTKASQESVISKISIDVDEYDRLKSLETLMQDFLRFQEDLIPAKTHVLIDNDFHNKLIAAEKFAKQFDEFLKVKSGK
jgi:hypothetical protein